METTQQVLRREAQRARYRHAWWIALVAGVSGNALLVLAMWAAAPKPSPAAVSVMPAGAPAAPIVVSSPVAPPVIVVMPQIAPALVGGTAFGDLGPCPDPHAERPSGGLRQPTDQEIKHVAGAPSDSRWIAAWNDFDVFASRDGGASWDEVLDGPGEVVDASFDCHGRVLVLREGNGLGMRDGVREAWRAVPGVELQASDEEYAPRYQPRVVGGGRSIAIVGPHTGGVDGDGDGWAAISDDGGVTWRHADLGWYEGVATAAWSGDTLRIVVPWTDCMSEGTRLVTVTAGGQKREELDQWSWQVGLDRGTPFVLSEYCEGRATPGAREPVLCVWRGREWRALDPAPVESRGEEGVVLQLVEGPADVLILNDIAQTLTGTRLGRARTLPSGFEPLGTDLAGRVWGNDADGRLTRR